MSIRSIFVPVLPNCDPVRPCEAALYIARRVGAHIDAVFIRADPADSLVAVPELAFAVSPEDIEREGMAAEAKAREVFETWRHGAGLGPVTPNDAPDAVFAGWTEYRGSIETILAKRGRLSDLIVFGHGGTSDDSCRYAFDAAVFGTGRPTLLVPKAPRPDLLDHVLIAWNGSLEGMRAVMGSIALLRQAGRVSIFSAPSARTNAAEAANLAIALRWHGIDTVCLAERDDASSVGARLLRACHDENASLLLMGAYTHGPVRQMLLGGVTKHVLDHATIPVLMAH